MWTCSIFAAILVLLSGVFISPGEGSQQQEGPLHSSGLLRLKRAAPDLTKTFRMKGTYKWELFFDVDNSNNSGVVERTFRIKTSEFLSYSELQKAASSFANSKSVGFKAGVPFDIINIEVSPSVTIDIKKEFSNVITSRREVLRNSSRHDTYRVGANSRLTLYRLVFTGPGMHEFTDILSSTPHKMDDIEIGVTGRQKYFLKDLQVNYTMDSISRPENALNEVNGQTPDIESGYPSLLSKDRVVVWLVPSWTLELDDGVTGIQFVRQRTENKDYLSLRVLTGGDFRYLKIQRDKYARERITEIALYRNPTRSPTYDGWDYVSADLNGGRKGDFLYLVWKVVRL